MPSYREGLPLTLFEAMASGLPIVASPVNGIPYEMKDNENGIFVQYGDVAGLVKAITKSIDDKQFSSRVRKNNVKRAKQYDWTLIANRVMAVYKEVLGAKRKR